MRKYKTHDCDEISLADIGKEVRIAGVVQTIRNHDKNKKILANN